MPAPRAVRAPVCSLWPLLPLAATTAAMACMSTSPTGFCTAPAPIAIEADVTDSVTGQGLADSASGSVQAGTYADSLHHISNSTTLLLGGTQLGTYNVTIARPGFATWTRSGVSVTQTGPCGNVLPVHLAALLQPAP